MILDGSGIFDVISQACGPGMFIWGRPGGPENKKNKKKHTHTHTVFFDFVLILGLVTWRSIWGRPGGPETRKTSKKIRKLYNSKTTLFFLLILGLVTWGSIWGRPGGPENQKNKTSTHIKKSETTVFDFGPGGLGNHFQNHVQNHF